MNETAGRSFSRLPHSERQEISVALLAFADGLGPLLNDCFGDEKAGSRAAHIAAGRFRSSSQGPFPGRNAIETAVFSTLAGLDHTRLFARCLGFDDAAFGLATLTRGAIESYARGWWLLAPTSDEDVVLRWLSALAKELQIHDRVRPNEVLGELRGRDSTAREEHRRVLDDIEAMSGSRSPIAFTYTELATEFTQQFRAGGRAAYSDLSGVAHGESLGLHGFVEADDASGTYKVALHERWGIAYAARTLSAASFAGRELLNFFGRGVAPSHPVARAHDDAARLVERAQQRLFRA